MTATHSGAYRDIAEIKLSYPLMEVVERTGVRLKRSGSHRWQGLCPFHADRNPSFFVDVERQRFVCFGCKARGDVIDFVRLHEQLSTVGEACNWLTGTPVPTATPQSRPSAPPGHRERRWDRLTLEQQLVLNAAGALYRDALWRNPRARAYLAERGVPDWVVRACGLGFADGRSLEAHLRKHGGLRIAEDLGLLSRPEPGEGGRMLRERFAGRIVIPELRGGQPIWFIGRYPDERNVRVKYLVLPGEKPVLGFERAAGRREAYLIEGVFDWLTAVSWHLPAFSTCGTDFPLDRLGWLARARFIFGVLDGDRAGREAAERFGVALGRRWQPLLLPDGSDLNDLGRRPGGRALFFRLVADARHQPNESPERIHVNKRVMAEPFRRGAPGQWEVRRLRAGVFRLGGYLGLDTRAVVRFGEAISGQRWRQCRRDDLERVLADFAQLADRVVLRRQWTDIEPAQLMEHPERPV